MEQNLTSKLAAMLRQTRLDREVRIMEICGTHTTEFFRTGVKELFPPGLTLIDGPGCPVCVTTGEYLDRAIQIGREHDAIIATFGDMIKVPSSHSSLAREQAEGMDVQVVYSPAHCLDLARTNPGRPVVFLSVGFETTAPAEAAVVLQARDEGIDNLALLCGNKLTPPAVDALLSAGEAKIDGFIIPGHVSAVIGSDAWNFIAQRHGRPGVVAGFEAADLISGVLILLKLLEQGPLSVKNAYTRAVTSEGNTLARETINRVFDRVDATWRGIGLIPGSGLGLRPRFAAFDAEQRFPVTMPEPREHPGCRCGDLLRGLITPPECPLFDTACRPENAVGPCMVSSEGPCAAYYKYWRRP
jgi:hydrogenase expression/formation protein HypD